MLYKIKRLLRLIFLLLCAAAVIRSAEAARPRKDEAVLRGVFAEQGGDSRLTVVVEGHRLPRPEIHMRNDGIVLLTFANVRFPALRWQKELNAPLAPFVEVEQFDGGTTVQLYGEAPLELGDVRGNGERLKLFFIKKTNRHGRELVQKERNAPVISRRHVTLKMTDCPVTDIVRSLSDLANVNIVLDSTVPRDATMTIAFVDAPFQEVLDFILRGHNLEYALVGRTVVIGARGTAGVLAGRLLTKSYRLSYADPQKCAGMVRELAELNSPANKVIVDERRQTLIVSASARQHERVRNVLQDIDSPGEQVMFKARIVEVNEDASNELEGAVNAVYKWWWGASQNGTFSTGAANYSQKNAQSGLPNLDTANLPGTIGSGVVDLAGTAARMIDVRIQSLVERSVARVLASPTVTVMDGEKASIKLVEKLKYVSRRDDAKNPTYGDEEVGPKLDVSVRIGRDGVITAGISLATGEVTQWIRGAQGEQIPQVNSRSVETKVRVRNGEPFVVGGLFKETTSRLRRGVPVLSDIPLLGALFSVRQTKKTRSQVVMILIPSILTIEDLAIRGKML